MPWLLVSVGCGVAGAALAWHHPLWPTAALTLFWLCTLAMAWWPGAWYFVVPACLPFLNFSPWSGWIVFDEFDLLLLGTLAGGYGRLAYRSWSGNGIKISRGLWGLVVVLGSANLLALCRGFEDAGGFSFDWFAGYTDALNSLRVFKSVGFALLFVPLLQRQPQKIILKDGQNLAAGMVSGMTVVALAVLWERAAFPGVMDFSAHYRTVALFWEMHVGGAAIDAYLAMATPFVVWALVVTRRPAAWICLAALALLTGYACLTTFSRGVYFSVLGSLFLLGILLWVQRTVFHPLAVIKHAWRRHQLETWRAKGSLFLVAALVSEVAVVLGGGSFMAERLASADRDLGSRIEHWQHGVGLLEGPTDWLLGKGLGRLPANYAAQGPRGEFSGDVRVQHERGQAGDTNQFVTLYGSKSEKKLAGLYALTQRVSEVSAGRYQISLDVRVIKPTDVYVELCERHLLYDGNCQVGFVRVLPNSIADKKKWRTLVMSLDGPTLDMGPWYARHLALLSLSVLNPGQAVDLDNVRLTGPKGRSLLENGHFSNALAHWLPAAQFYFLPWHMDNLILEALVERGVIGLALFLTFVGYALWHLVFGRARSMPLSPYLAASLSAVLLVGLISSVMDTPRIFFMAYILTLFSIQLASSNNCKEFSKNQ